MIKFAISPRWKRHWTAETEKNFVKRVADIVVGGVHQNEGVPYQKEKDGHNWTLDTGNDWWLSIEGDEATLSYRYDAPGNISQEQWTALKTVIEWVFNR